MDDREIIKRVKQGDVDCFRVIVERYHRPLLSFLYTLTRNSGMAEDIGQTVFLALYKALDSFDVERGEPISAWLFLVARNQAFNAMKKESRFVVTGCVEETYEDSRETDPVELLIRKQDREILEACLAKVAEPYGSVLKQSLQGASIEEIALAERVVTGTVKSRLYRARKQVAALFKALMKEVRYD